MLVVPDSNSNGNRKSKSKSITNFRLLYGPCFHGIVIISYNVDSYNVEEIPYYDADKLQSSPVQSQVPQKNALDNYC